MHEHFDAAGEKTGHTVVTRESEWDDESRGRALRLIEYEDSLCKCGCNLPIAVAHKRQAFKVDHFTCYAGRAIEMKRRMDRKEHEKDDGWADGKHYYAVVPEVKEGQRGD